MVYGVKAPKKLRSLGSGRRRVGVRSWPMTSVTYARRR